MDLAQAREIRSKLERIDEDTVMIEMINDAAAIVEEKGSIYIRVHDSDNNFKNNIVIPREGAGKVLDVIRQHFVEHKSDLNREIEEM